MKKIVTILMIAVFSLAIGNKEAKAQNEHNGQYNYTDVKTGSIYNLYIKFSGYQVQVWIKNNTSKKWLACTVTKTSDEIISYKYGKTKYNAKLDPNNKSAIVVWNADYTQKWVYYKM